MRLDSLSRLAALLIRPWSPRRHRGLRQVAALNVLILAGTLGLYAAGWLDGLEYLLMDRRFELIRGQASGDLVIVQIDGKSIQQAGRWPWPRDRFARLIDRLFEAGATDVALDVDFSSMSSLSGDAELAATLRRYGGRVILGAFNQKDEAGQPSAALLDVRPLQIFANSAAVAGVNVDVAHDGAVRRYPIGQFDGRSFRPSMGALLAGNARLDFPFFYIDFGIDPRSIPRLSVADILDGRFDPAAVRGRKVIVGATALDLGDYVTVPVYRALSGVTLQALAYESLVEGRALRRSGPAVTVAVLLMLALGAAAGARRWSWRRATLAALATSLACLALSVAVQAAWPLSLDIAPWLVLIGFFVGVRSVREIESQAIQIFKQRMAGAYRRALMAQVVEDSFDGIVITDSLGRVELFNSAAAEILGLQASEVHGRPLARILPTFEAFQQPVEPADPAQGRLITFERADGRRCILELQVGRSSIQVSRNPRERRSRTREVTVFTFRDVTDRVQAREAERAASERAMLASRAKTEFLANMSHELRTPLNAVIGFSEMIGEEMLGPISPPAYKGYAQDINASGLHLLRMVNEVLDVAKIEAGKVQLDEEQFPLAGLVNSCAGMIRGSLGIDHRRLVLDGAADLPYVRGDERLLKQVVLNLLSNAVKFSPEDRDIVMTVGMAAEGWAKISVRDYGIGIPSDRLTDVLKPFVQIEQAMNRKHEGAGLGLHIASTYAEMHGGHIEIESRLGAGTVASLWLPPDRLLPRDAARARRHIRLVLDRDRDQGNSG
ncbi:PAS domain S-box-containing protein [Tistlia consotensis]|uniref:histidine kinase n=1 Tax=Tistlia consotensis USBA 355 TaxID=560819 RepID=A0A1Y6CDP2_9PROT|nr:CHASE2 domain-containing protein [Tistlia consotensis]SMF58312.1 PAS domain S-box-containing protein [Tistlia consotensis USBA 355]SNR63161.1 PAS domain S-box-containing protein [Tistlia consotensis]